MAAVSDAITIAQSGKVRPQVFIAGADVGKVNHVSLDQPFNGHHSFTIAVSLKEKTNTLLDLGSMYIGQKISIMLTAGYYRTPGELEFNGFVTNVKLSKHENSLMQLVIQGYSPTKFMDDGPHNQSWKEKTLEDVVGAVTAKYDVQVATDLSHTEPIPYINQYKESSWHFLRRKMSTYGQWCYYDGEQLVLGTPPAGEEIHLTFGKEMTALDLSADIVPADFKVMGYNYVDDAHFDTEGSASSVSGFDELGNMAMSAAAEAFKNKPNTIEPYYSTDKSVLEIHAKRRASGQGAKFVNLYGQSSHLGLRVGQVIIVKAEDFTTSDGAGPADYGSFRIVHLTHGVDGLGNYSNNFQAIPAGLETPPSQDEDITPPQAQTQPGEVLENDDPDGLGRVQVQLPWQKEEGESTPWIRVSTIAAGGGHGNYFVPEIGDAVLVGFTWNNPDRPIVVGSLYNSTTKHEGAHDPDNNTKIIKTKSGNRVTFSDAPGEESIIIENGTNVITLSLEGNTTIKIETAGDLIMHGKTVAITADESFTLNSDTSQLTSAAATTIKAGAELALNADKDAELTSKKNVLVEATANLTADGKAKAEVTSVQTAISGSTKVDVTGAIVNIN